MQKWIYLEAVNVDSIFSLGPLQISRSFQVIKGFQVHIWLLKSRVDYHMGVSFLNGGTPKTPQNDHF